VPLLPLERQIGVAKTSIRSSNGHEWEALIVMRRHRTNMIKIRRRVHIRNTSQMSDEIHVQAGETYYAWTRDGSRRKAQRIVEQLNRRDGLNVPIARTVEVRVHGV
jgi:hypothetical protein